MDIRVVIPWWIAIRHAHDTDDLKPLSVLFRSDKGLPPEARQMLAALFERRMLKKKRGGQRPMFKESAEGRLARLASDVKRLQSGELKLLDELTGEAVRKLGFRIDPKSARELDKSARELGKLRNPSGRMRRDDAIDLIARRDGVEPQTLADYMAGKRGASRGGWRRWPSKKRAKQVKK